MAKAELPGVFPDRPVWAGWAGGGHWAGILPHDK